MATETEQSSEQPWEAICAALERANREELEQVLERLGPAETARGISRLESEEQNALFQFLACEDAADVLESIPEAQAAEVLDDLSCERAAAIVDEMSADKRADILGELDQENAEAILTEMSSQDAAEVRRILAFPPDTAGGIMLPDFVAFSDRKSVAEVLDELRHSGEEFSDYEIQYAYVVDESGQLHGVLRLRDLLFARRGAAVTEVMLADPIHVDARVELSELREMFEQHSFLGIPVTENEQLVGVVHRRQVNDAIERESGRTLLRLTGIQGGEELRSMPLPTRAGRRLSWLSVNVLLNLLAASVIAFYQDTLEQAIVLAVFLPIISDMSGCSGNQAVAVSMRELTLGLIKPSDLGHVLMKEVSVGLINGLALGALLAAAAMLWQQNPLLGLVVGGALGINTLVAVTLGGLLPLGMRRAGYDPALASGPILTTVTDVCGFFVLLSLATSVLPGLST